MPFLTPLRVEDIDGTEWTLIEPLVYESRDGRRYEVPAGFHTDFGTIPRIFWMWLPKSGKYNEATVVHDYLYKMGVGTRAQADRLLKEAMEDLGVPGRTLWVLYISVRIGGRGRGHFTE